VAFSYERGTPVHFSTGYDCLQAEDLELLVGVVDAELLEVVGLEVLEPEDVEDRDAARLHRLLLH